MKNIILVFILFLISTSTRAELIDGPANVRSVPNGDILYELYDDTEVFPKNIGNGWYSLELSACVHPSEFSIEEQVLNGGATLFSCRSGYAIGSTKVDMRVEYLTCSDKECVIYIREGVTYKTNIDGDMSVEESLRKIVKKGDVRCKAFLNHMQTYQYHGPTEYDHGLKMHYAPGNYIWNESPLPRVLLFFHKDNLFAIAWLDNTPVYNDGVRPGKFYYVRYFSDDKNTLSMVYSLILHHESY